MASSINNFCSRNRPFSGYTSYPAQQSNRRTFAYSTGSSVGPSETVLSRFRFFSLGNGKKQGYNITNTDWSDSSTDSVFFREADNLITENGYTSNQPMRLFNRRNFIRSVGSSIGPSRTVLSRFRFFSLGNGEEQSHNITDYLDNSTDSVFFGEADSPITENGYTSNQPMGQFSKRNFGYSFGSSETNLPCFSSSNSSDGKEQSYDITKSSDGSINSIRETDNPRHCCFVL